MKLIYKSNNIAFILCGNALRSSIKLYYHERLEMNILKHAGL